MMGQRIFQEIENISGHNWGRNLPILMEAWNTIGIYNSRIFQFLVGEEMERAWREADNPDIGDVGFDVENFEFFFLS